MEETKMNSLSETDSEQLLSTDEERVVLRTYDRQLDLYNPEKHQIPVVVVGAGTIGSWTTLFLAKLGVDDIAVFDHDEIELQNTANQLYGPHGVGMKKGDELYSIVRDLTEFNLQGDNTQFPPEDLGYLPNGQFVLIVTVDSMKSRIAIHEWMKMNFYRVSLFIDSRVGGEVGRVFAYSPSSADGMQKYEATLHSDTSDPNMSEELRKASEVKCTARSIIDVSVGVASRIVNTFRRFATGREIVFETDIDFRNDIWLTTK